MKENDRATEADWIHRSKRGDKHAFGLLVNKYMRQGYYAALAFLGSHSEALDASQEAFVKAYRAMKTFQEGRRFYTWYYRILKNHCLNVLRDRTAHVVPLSIVEEIDPVSTEQSADAAMEGEERRRAVWAALWKLDPEDRELLVARDLLDTPYATLAELLDVPLGTVMSRLYHARRKLRLQLGEEWR